MGEEIKTYNFSSSIYQGGISPKCFLAKGGLGKVITELGRSRESIMKISDRGNFKKKLNTKNLCGN